MNDDEVVKKVTKYLLTVDGGSPRRWHEEIRQP